MEPEYIEIGSRIERARAGRGLTKRAMSETLHVSEQLVGQWEKGQKRIQIVDLFRVAEVLGGRIEEFLSGERRPSVYEPGQRYPSRSASVTRLLDIVEELPPPEQDELLELARIKLRRYRSQRTAG